MESYEEGMDLSCKNCKFYSGEEYEYDEVSYTKTYGNCLRYPPKRIDGVNSGFPVVENEWWCGEHQKKFVEDDK